MYNTSGSLVENKTIDLSLVPRPLFNCSNLKKTVVGEYGESQHIIHETAEDQKHRSSQSEAEIYM